MDRSERDKLQAAIEEKRKAKLEAAESDYLGEIAALEKIWELCQSMQTPDVSQGNGHDDGAAIPPAPAPPRPAPPRPRHGAPETPTVLIRRVLPELPGRFMNQTVRQHIEGMGLNVTTKEIASVLNKMRKRGEITTIRQGTPNSPAIYSFEAR
jgi:hypothetical protein